MAEEPWDCVSCTLHNTVGTRCDACDEPAPHAIGIVSDQKPAQLKTKMAGFEKSMKAEYKRLYNRLGSFTSRFGGSDDEDEAAAGAAGSAGAIEPSASSQPKSLAEIEEPVPGCPPPAMTSRSGHSLDGSGAFADAAAADGQLSAVCSVANLKDDEATRAAVHAALTGELGAPPGLAALTVKDRKAIGVRIFILDDSGSMLERDRQRFGLRGIEPCSRWEEVVAMALSQVRWHAAACVPCQFHLLNGKANSGGGPGFRKVAPGDDLAEFERWLEGVTPCGLTDAVSAITHVRLQLESISSELQNKQKQAFIILVTDGEPTPPTWGSTGVQGDRALQCLQARSHMVLELRRLSGELPVTLVVRLCTDDAGVLAFYESLDTEYELTLDVLGDLRGEGEEVGSVNPFLTYGPPLHTYREGGSTSQLFDRLDEEAFNPTERKVFTRFLLGISAPEPDAASDALPPPELQLTTWDPVTMSEQLWIMPQQDDEKGCCVQ